MEKSISKILTANDTGETGGHQAGILIPKQRILLEFFPTLDKSKRNPRVELQFTDESGQAWKFNYIYYNNKSRGGTRNEYRLTRMTKYLRESELATGDEIILSRDTSYNYFVSYRRSVHVMAHENNFGVKIIRLGSNWKIIDV